ncbi:MAG: DegT/DnrJ/EryC1/StrS family aminotransferase [Acidobacteriota bacterium]
MTSAKVPFFRPQIGDAEIREVLDTLQSGWLTTGPRVKRFEIEFAAAVRGAHAVAVNSCTAALHLAVEALGLKPEEIVVIPTMTFAATAEVIRYLGALPLLVDCDATTQNMDLEDVERKIAALRAGRLPRAFPKDARVAGVIPVHVGGLLMDITAVRAQAARNGWWVVEDAAHAFPAAWRREADEPWQYCGSGSADVTCFSFYANKTITTGEGGMAVTERPELAERMRLMSLHGLSQDAWERYSGGHSWDYRIMAPGYKYNMTDIAAAIGIAQLARAEAMRVQRERIADRYRESMQSIEEIELPPADSNRIHSWHLFPIRLRLERLRIDRNAFLDELRAAGIGFSVHWRPLHLHPYYRDSFGWSPDDLPNATAVWERLVSLPLFPGMRDEEILRVVRSVSELCAKHRRIAVAAERA